MELFDLHQQNKIVGNSTTKIHHINVNLIMNNAIVSDDFRLEKKLFKFPAEMRAKCSSHREFYSILIRVRIEKYAYIGLTFV